MDPNKETLREAMKNAVRSNTRKPSVTTVFMRFDFTTNKESENELNLALENWGRLFLKWKKAGLLSGLDSKIIQKYPTIYKKDKNKTTIDITVDKIMKIAETGANFSNRMYASIGVAKKG